MKYKNILLIAILFGITIHTVSAQNQPPEVSNVIFSQRTDGTFLVDIYYDVNDPENDAMTVSIKVSSDNGVTWDFSCNYLEGDIDPNITSGTGKHIEWDFGSEHSQTFGDQFRIKIIADDGTIVMNIPCPGLPKVYYEGGPNNDIGGDYYNTVLIGDQCWLRENLNIGTRIDGILDQTNNTIMEKYCYDNLEANCKTYGGLYQWNEAMQFATTESAQGICPEGWHIPTYAEFQTLTATVNNDGNMLKEIGEGTGAGEGTNTSGFSALLAGFRYYDLYFFLFLGIDTIFWSSTEINADDAYNLLLDGYISNINLEDGGNKEGGFSVRCLKD